MRRDLHRLKYVCKEWHHLISDRGFTSLQLNKSEKVVGFFFQERYEYSDHDINCICYIPIETETHAVHRNVFSFMPESVVVLASCNGLICCRSSIPCLEPTLYVCNPLNKERRNVKWIHPCENTGQCKCIYPFKRTSIALSFDPLQVPFGDAMNFSIVTVYQAEGEAEDDDGDETEEFYFRFAIYSSETRNWRRSAEICRCMHNLSKSNAIFVDGCLYWLTDGNQILMFDHKHDISCLVRVPIPSSQFKTIPEMCLGESEGKLQYAVLCEDGLQLWTLIDHFACHWDLRFSISLDEFERENSSFINNLAMEVARPNTIDTFPYISLLAFKDEILFARISIDVFSYNFETREMKKLCKLSELGTDAICSPIALPYTMSLVPLGSESLVGEASN